MITNTLLSVSYTKMTELGIFPIILDAFCHILKTTIEKEEEMKQNLSTKFMDS